jgi:hypothetical protein
LTRRRNFCWQRSWKGGENEKCCPIFLGLSKKKETAEFPDKALQIILQQNLEFRISFAAKKNDRKFKIIN